MNFADDFSTTDHEIDAALDGAGEGWGVFLYNDDEHSMHAVATQLMIALDCSVQHAWRIMQNANTHGFAVATVTGKTQAHNVAEVLKTIKLKVEVIPLG